MDNAPTPVPSVGSMDEACCELEEKERELDSGGENPVCIDSKSRSQDASTGRVEVLSTENGNNVVYQMPRSTQHNKQWENLRCEVTTKLNLVPVPDVGSVQLFSALRNECRDWSFCKQDGFVLTKNPGSHPAAKTPDVTCQTILIVEKEGKLQKVTFCYRGEASPFPTLPEFLDCQQTLEIQFLAKARYLFLSPIGRSVTQTV